MTGEKGGLLAGLRAEALKSRHAAPVRLAVLMALPMPLLGAMPYRGVQIFSAWNYWYALFLPVALARGARVARADARTRMRGLLGLGFRSGAPGGPRRSGASRSACSRTSWSSASTSRDRRLRRASRPRARSRCSSARSPTR